MTSLNKPRLDRLYDRKHQEIIDAATKLFIEEGYERTSMEAVAKLADASKVTVYKHFQNKERLFSDMITQHLEAYTESMPQMAFNSDVSIRENLQVFCLQMVNFLLNKRSTQLMRRVIGEINQFPNLSSALWPHGDMPFLRKLATYLQGQQQRGLLYFPDPYMGAQQLVGMIKEAAVYPVWFGIVNHKPTKDALHKTIESAVALFLNFYSHKKETQELPTTQGIRIKPPMSARLYF